VCFNCLDLGAGCSLKAVNDWNHSYKGMKDVLPEVTFGVPSTC